MYTHLECFLHLSFIHFLYGSLSFLSAHLMFPRKAEKQKEEYTSSIQWDFPIKDFICLGLFKLFFPFLIKHWLHTFWVSYDFFSSEYYQSDTSSLCQPCLGAIKIQHRWWKKDSSALNTWNIVLVLPGSNSSKMVRAGNLGNWGLRGYNTTPLQLTKLWCHFHQLNWSKPLAKHSKEIQHQTPLNSIAPWLSYTLTKISE